MRWCGAQAESIITRDASAAHFTVLCFTGVRGVFRCDSTTRDMQFTQASRCIHGHRPKRIEFECEDAEVGDCLWLHPGVLARDRYYVTWCNGYHGPTSAWLTHDFKTFYQMENAFLRTTETAYLPRG